MRLTLNIWRQKSPVDKGQMVPYTLDNVSEHMSFLEMLDVLNETLTKTGGDPIAFDHDCREGICGSCAMMINGRRVAASTYVVDRGAQLVLDGQDLAQPYTLTAIGEAATLTGALGIPRGIVDTAEDAGARIRVEGSTEVVVDALRVVSPPRYARPVPAK